MALPDLPDHQKDWDHSRIDQSTGALGTASANQRQAMWLWVNALLTYADVPCTCFASANGAAMSVGSSNWASYLDIHGFPAVNSWIVLNFPGLGGMQMLLSPTLDFGYTEWALRISPAGLYTGGSVAVPPTAIDEIDCSGATATLELGRNAANTAYITHVLHSRDGECNRVMIMCLGKPIVTLAFERAQYPVPGWTIPNWVLVDCLGEVQSQLAPPDYYRLNRYVRSAAFSPPYFLGQAPGGATMHFGAMIRGANNALASSAVQLFPGRNEISLEQEMTRFGLYGIPVGARGEHGLAYDWWAYRNATFGHGDYVTDDAGVIKYAIFGDWLWPWADSVPVTGGAAGVDRYPFYTFDECICEAGDMAIRFLENGLAASFGDDLALQKNVLISGQRYFVSSVDGDNTYSGIDRNRPVATIAAAVALAVAGDTIVLMANHTETLTVSQVLSLSGLKVVGEGTGPTVPRLTCGGAVNMLDVTGNGILLANISFPASTAAATSRIRIGARGVKVRNCVFDCGANDTNRAVSFVTGASSCTVKDTTFTSVAGRPAVALEVVNAMDDLMLENLTFDGGSFGWSDYALKGTAAITNMLVAPVQLLNGSRAGFATGTTGLFGQGAPVSGSPEVDWVP